MGRRRAPAARCECGAPILWGSHFCANCGRPVGEAPVVACTSCGHPLPGDASFCASCGTKVEQASLGTEQPGDATVVSTAYEQSEELEWEQEPPASEPGRARDPWEQ
jgi:DNA-directed RNA polymerase subunit RPC12/RpoP